MGAEPQDGKISDTALMEMLKTSMSRRLLLFFFIVLQPSSRSLAQTAEEIMCSVRQVAILQGQQNLNGQIRKGSKKIPLTLFLRGRDLQFALRGGAERFHLRLNEGGQELFEIVKGKTRPFPPEKISQAIGGTDVSYEDLALTFLDWENPRIVGQQRLNGEDCWRLHVVNPGESGRYREVSVWVTQKHRALARVVGFGPAPDSRPLKQFEITGLMRVKGRATVKSMKVTAFNEERRVKGMTYLEFEHPGG